MIRDEISDRDALKAQAAHELFLFNAIFNHVFLFIATVSAPSLQVLTLIVPVLSVGLMVFTLYRAKQTRTRESAYVSCHWQLAARRTLIFAGMWFTIGVTIAMVFVGSHGNLRPQHYAFSALGFFPIMGTFLVLVLMESEALQHARHKSLPRKVNERCRLQRALSFS